MCSLRALCHCMYVGHDKHWLVVCNDTANSFKLLLPSHYVDLEAKIKVWVPRKFGAKCVWHLVTDSKFVISTTRCNFFMRNLFAVWMYFSVYNIVCMYGAFKFVPNVCVALGSELVISTSRCDFFIRTSHARNLSAVWMYFCVYSIVCMYGCVHIVQNVCI